MFALDCVMTEVLMNILHSPNFWGIVAPALVGIGIFYKTKSAEREAEWRKEKLRLYLQFVEALSGITDAEKSIDGEVKFAKSCNDLHAFSPNSVLKALHRYQDLIGLKNTNSKPKEKNAALNILIWEMRNDLKISPLEKKEDFKILLWTSGINPT